MPHPACHLPSAESQKKTAPLTGWRVLVTRPDTPETSLSEGLKLLGAEVHTYPLVEIVPPRSWDSFDRTLSSAEKADWIIFTSRNGFEFCSYSSTNHLKMFLQSDFLSEVNCTDQECLVGLERK